MLAVVPRKTDQTSSRSFSSFVQRNCHYNLRDTTEDGGKNLTEGVSKNKRSIWSWSMVKTPIPMTKSYS